MIYHNEKRIISNVERADTLFKRSLGLMFRRQIKNDYALLFSFERKTVCDVHMLFVPFDIDIIFLDCSGAVVDLCTLKAWTGVYKVECCSFIECKKGTISIFDIRIGDKLSIYQRNIYILYMCMYIYVEKTTN